MNYYLKKSLNKYHKNYWNNIKTLTNTDLIKALYCIETVHRNFLWRLFEYLYWVIFPRKYSHKRILTIGKFQIKTIYLNNKSKIKNIINSNKIETIDKLLYDYFPDADWNSLPDDLLLKIVSFYNGDKSGNYFNAIKILLHSN
jgi:hypothetical protein